MSSDAASPSIMVPGLKDTMKAIDRSRAGSQSTSAGYAPSIFSEAESFATANTSPSQYSVQDDDVVDKEAFEAHTDSDSDFEEISKETFEANVGRRDSDNTKNGGVKVILGSTLGGKDPLHAMVQATGHEPRWWVEERQRESKIDKKRKRTSTKKTSTSMYKPDYFDDLPYSPQDYFTSGLDLDCEPEETSEEFWEKVGEAFKLNSRYETVEERREQFEYDCFGSPPATPSPSRFNDELSVMG
ncbi:hypothetical protein M409DRAFT_59032 [Zasmidium cellare ATCC 36951]|uniref:Uncharacterized protein n=1 Tax=Zasmidium cellare ATCC 36951 TaxID=1080233 RepID=A0A6A6C623_ZASCE|nr:uncharacterized protein M409DRAFT_59032 [Zasmidium cellare ATCC 36951]KAF2161650.1 hypothetical protein M409DRAFT_59032 [Zasmidium cellare ATCC 36951]